MAVDRVAGTRTRADPVYAGYFADPFVWETRGVYYAIGTGADDANGTEAGKAFPILQSDDLIEWRFVSNALLRPDPALGSHFWAPEVAYHDGRFYLYYSVGHGDKRHQLRVAASTSPQGPYDDLGVTLVDPAECPFAIDPHPFQDVDGQWYLFYARDFLETDGGRAGTALVVAPMDRMARLSDEGSVVLRAHWDWQRFQRNREMYGRVWDWHTLEGPFVWRHDGRYYCFYSGGRWDSQNYGVDFAVADQVMGPYTDAGNESGPRVLRSIQGRLIGPGHNSIVVGPDDETEYIVYHAWNAEMTLRQMHVSPLDWTPEGPRALV